MTSRSETGETTSPQQEDITPARDILDGVADVFSLALEGKITTSSDGHFGEIGIKPEELAASRLSQPIKDFFVAVCAIPDPKGEMKWAHPQPTVRLLNTGRSGSIWLGMISQSHGVFGLMVEGRTATVFHGKRVNATIMASSQSTESANKHRARLNRFGIGEEYRDLVKYVKSAGAVQVAKELFAFAESVTQPPLKPQHK